MSKITTAAKWSLPVLGGVLVVGVQTPPDAVKSNTAKWVQEIVGLLPDWPPYVDALVTGFGALLIIIGVYLWLRDRRARLSAPNDFANLPQGNLQAPPKQSKARGSTRATDSILEEYDRLSRWALADARVGEAARIAGPPTNDRDKRIFDALGYALSGAWDAKWDDLARLGSPMLVFHKPAREFRDGARNGRLRVWARREPRGRFELIDEAYWETHELDVPSILIHESKTKACGSDETTDLLYDIMVNRFEAEMYWNHAG